MSARANHATSPSAAARSLRHACRRRDCNRSGIPMARATARAASSHQNQAGVPPLSVDATASVGLGDGVGDSVGVGLGLAVFVAVAVAVAVAVSVAVAVAVTVLVEFGGSPPGYGGFVVVIVRVGVGLSGLVG